MTKNHRCRDRPVMMSSVRPSAKYSCSGSRLMFWKRQDRDRRLVRRRQRRSAGLHASDLQPRRAARLPIAGDGHRLGNASSTSPTKRNPRLCKCANQGLVVAVVAE